MIIKGLKSFSYVFQFNWLVIGQQCNVLNKFHVDIWDADFEDSISDLTSTSKNNNGDREIKSSQIMTESVGPYFKPLQDVKIKCESYVEYLPPELFYYIFDCHSQLSIVQVRIWYIL